MKNKPTTNTGESYSEQAAMWRSKLAAEFNITDIAGQLLLDQAAYAFDRAAQARALIERDGCTSVDRFGQPRAHPACVIERDAMSALRAALRQLNLDMTPTPDRGVKPSGSR